MNNATCEQKSSFLPPEQRAGFTCSCPPGFTAPLCEEDIDDCLNNKCSPNGRCIDKIDSYLCKCTEGFTGKFCEINIDECQLYKPCQNGGTCRDGINDYTCICPYPNLQNLYFGDKNCSTELIGCKQSSNPCEPGVCLPSFRNGIDNAFDCQCNKETTGSTCKKSAVISFRGNSAWRTEGRGKPTALPKSGVKLEFWFRTTVVGRSLFGAESSRSSVLSLSLNDSYTLVAIMNDISLSVSSPDNIADGSENFVSLEIRPEYLLLELKKQGKNISNVIRFPPRNVEMNDMTFGGIWNCPTPCFIGCMSGVYVYPEENTDRIKTYIEAPGNAQTCSRKVQCDQNSCSNRGICMDMWFDFKCICDRPYLGQHCELEGQSLTLYENTSILFNINNYQDSIINMSFFFRTRATSVELVFLRTGHSNFVVHLNKTSFNVNDKALISKSFADGMKHYINIEVTDIGQLNVKVDGEWASLVIPEKKITIFSVELEPKAKISLQDMRINKKLLLLRNSSLLENFLNESFTPLNLEGRIDLGEITADKCAQNVCNMTNTINCNNIFYDDYNCTCGKEWTGKNCDINDFCFLDPCKNISNSSCLNKPSRGGFHCVVNATLEEAVNFELDTPINYKSFKNTLFMEIRSRSPSNLFKMVTNLKELKLRINFDHITITYEDTQCSFQNSLLNGEWREIKLEFSDKGVLYNGKNCARIKESSIFKNLANESAKITIGENFKGCMGQIFLGDELLSWIKNSPGIKTSYKLNALSALQIGCHPPNLCKTSPCKNGICVDDFYKFRCSCNSGWDGNLCSRDIDECSLLQTCKNGATCVNFDGGFSCYCVPGYTGKR